MLRTVSFTATLCRGGLEDDAPALLQSRPQSGPARRSRSDLHALRSSAHVRHRLAGARFRNLRALPHGTSDSLLLRGIRWRIEQWHIMALTQTVPMCKQVGQLIAQGIRASANRR